MDGVEVRAGVQYGVGGGRPLRCDVYAARGRSALSPAVLLVHGGGWRQGDRGMMQGYGERFAAARFVCMAPEYRLTPEAPWPAQMQDVKAAIRWLRSQSASLGVDERQIGMLGSSAGAHLALLAAGTAGRAEFTGDGGNAGSDETLAAIVAIFPPTLFHVGEAREHGSLAARVLLGDGETTEAAQAASPLTHVSAEFPPTLLLHGTADKVVPPSASMIMYEALVAAGVPVELHLYSEQPHGFARQPEFIDQVSAESIHFLRRYLVARAPAAVAAAV
jgi:acetyl esterase/lipase